MPHFFEPTRKRPKLTVGTSSAENSRLGTSGYESSHQSCVNSCCEFVAWKSSTCQSPTKDLRYGRAARDLSGSSSKDIIKLLSREKHFLGRPTDEKNLIHTRTSSTQVDSKTSPSSKLKVKITPLRVNQNSNHGLGVCLKSLVDTSEDDFKTAIARQSGSSSSEDSVLTDGSLHSALLKAVAPKRVEAISNPEDDELEPIIALVKTSCQSSSRNATELAEWPSSHVHSNVQRSTLTCTIRSHGDDSATSVASLNGIVPMRDSESTSFFKSNFKLSMESVTPCLKHVKALTEIKSTAANDITLSESPPKSPIKQCEIPSLTIKQPKSGPLIENLKTVTKLLSCDFYQMQKTSRKNYFNLYCREVHKVDIFGTITKINQYSQNKIAYTIDDGTASISCILNCTEREAKKNCFLDWLKEDNRSETSGDKHFLHAEESDATMRSAVTGMKSIVQNCLKTFVEDNHLKLGDTIHGVGVLYNYKTEKNIALYEIRQVNMREVEDRLHQIIFYYETLYPKLMKDFKRFHASATTCPQQDSIRIAR